MNRCATAKCDCLTSMPRRDFLKLTGLAAAGLSLRRLPTVAGPFETSDFAYTLIPADKKLSESWLRSLTQRGQPSVYKGTELDAIGMPVGGICAGQMYLGGDGRLWHWDIFNAPDGSLMNPHEGKHYAQPMKPESPLEQGFAIKVQTSTGVQYHRLDKTGFPEVRFCGQYPIGTVNYRDVKCPVEVKLDAYSPFIPLNVEDSSLPATVLEFAVKNISSSPVDVELAGWLENAVCKFSCGAVGVRRNRIIREGAMTRLEISAREGGKADSEIFEDFEKPGYEGWKVEGSAFGNAPVTQGRTPEYQGSLGLHGRQGVNSHASAPGTDLAAKDAAIGRMVSREFTITRDVIEFLIGGGSNPGKLGLNLVTDGKVVRSATGKNANAMTTQSWDVRDLKGRKAHFEILDSETGSWGNTGVDFIRFRDAGRPDIMFADFEKGSYESWIPTGTAFGDRPATLASVPEYQSPQSLDAHGEAFVNSHASAPGSDMAVRDNATGRLVSPDFTIERNFIRFLIGGGSNAGKLGLHLLVNGRVVRSCTGRNENKLRTHFFDVRDLAGRTAQMEIVDAAGGSWGNIGVDHIVFTDEGPTPVSATDAPDSGTLTLALLQAEPGDRACPDVADFTPEAVFEALRRTGDTAEKSIPEKIIGAVGRRWTLKPGEEKSAVFLIAWHFPRVDYTIPQLNGVWSNLQDISRLQRHYAGRFRNAAEVAMHVGKDFLRLSGETRRWRDTWYDSTLPHWLLDRALLNVSTLATNTCHRFDNGRYWFWEGVYCCPGTCTHVWHYAQAVARIFPEIERGLRERVDYGVGFDPASGVIGMRAENHPGPATDGQAGTILRTLREHQMSPDDAFLKRNWPRVKRAVEWLVAQDENGDGVISRAQPNTLDADWYGEISWISSLYVAALKAGAEMALDMGDPEAAREWLAIADKGTGKISELLFHKEQFFVQRPDPAHLDKLGSGYGCEIDQVFGQSWAFQVGLNRVLPADKTRRALSSLWRYNFTPDVGPFRQASPVKGGRWYAMAGEGGMIMSSFPDPEHPRPIGDHWSAMYFNECMSGFEYQVASHMVWEGGDLLEKGLAIARMIHDRYHASRRNPWNEVECGDHYGRAMASYGVFTAACGFEYYGPKGRIGFDPRLHPENFKAPFTASEGWGTFSQQLTGTGFAVELAVRWGKLSVTTLRLRVPGTMKSRKVSAMLDGKNVGASLSSRDGRTDVSFPPNTSISTGKTLRILITA